MNYKKIAKRMVEKGGKGLSIDQLRLEIAAEECEIEDCNDHIKVCQHEIKCLEKILAQVRKTK
jgi:hypothetical protein